MPLHYTKSGNLDMRYSSSKAAMSSSSSYGGGGGSGSSSSRLSYSSSSASYGGSGLHYKKDGSLDMRYSSSREAASSGHNVSSSSSGDLHYKKDGTLDMRYSSSKEATSSERYVVSSGDFHRKKDGTPDMRYSSSKAAAANELLPRLRNLNVTPSRTAGIPSYVPLTKSGTPDMRTKAAKDWVARQAEEVPSRFSEFPRWLPKRKDGTLDTTKAAVRDFLVGLKNRLEPLEVDYQENHRIDYYKKKLAENESFDRYVERERRAQVLLPKPFLLPNTEELSKTLARTQVRTSVVDLPLPTNVPRLDYTTLKSSFGDDEEACTLGRGAFGVVLKGQLNGKEVAVKKLHLSQLNKREKESFLNELNILAVLGEHPNLVVLYGYALDPPCLVMEFVKMGSLNYLLHYSEDPEVEAKMTDGRIKKKILLGIANGMSQLHVVGVLHCDLKPQNVLISEEYVAKITDFGLATLRAKTSSSVASTVVDDGENVIAGTAAYMAPELLDSNGPPQRSSDVYSYGILTNELIQEEEPYSGQQMNFFGRGNFGAANYAKNGNRPKIGEKTPSGVKRLIERCWQKHPEQRPTFESILTELMSLDIPNSF